MKVITRFAPSPTGRIHIGNMRSAVFSWLFARHHGGEFLLRIEDTDRERTTPEAVRAISDAMEWLGLAHDREIEYQSRYAPEHLAAAERLLAGGHAYRARDGRGGEPVCFGMPWHAERIACMREKGVVERKLHPGAPVEIGRSVSFARPNRDGEPVREEGCLAGFKHMRLFGAGGEPVFSLDEHFDEITRGASFSVPGVCSMTFMRREVFFQDMVKGEMAKPLDGMKDLVIVRGNNTPVFHLANVCDDARQGTTHIIRGEDHVENTFRHILLFNALGLRAPEYAHLPMVVNEQGKPYSKRDGDVFVGDFRKQGYLGDALFNYLALLGWSPGDDREIMGRDEMIELFDINRIKSSPARVDLKKLLWLNGVYMAAMPRPEYEAEARAVLQSCGLWNDAIPEAYFKAALNLMGDRIKLRNDFARLAGFFFANSYRYDEKAVQKRLRKPGVRENLAALRERFLCMETFGAETVEAVVRSLAESRGLKPAELIHPLRVAVSGLMEGPGLYDMLELLGRERVCARIDRTLKMLAS